MRKIILPVLLICAIVIISCDRRAVAEGEIVLINTDTVDREGIAHELDAINAFNPKLVAIDVQFSGDTDARKDTILLSALKHTKNLIMVSIIDDYGGGEHTHYRRFASGSLPAFLAVAKTGFANTIVEQNEMRTLNRFSTHAYVAEHIEYHFAVRVAMAFDSLLAVRYVKNHPRIVDVDYRNGARHFKVFGSADVLGKKIPRKDIEGKIVMLGFLGPGNEDKFFTPLNTNADEPDMHGLLYLAHIVAQILETR